MNTMGKILVICNLLIALGVAGFLVVDFATRTNWKIYADQLKAEMAVREANFKTIQVTAQKSNTEAKKAKDDLYSERNVLNQKVEDHNTEVSKLKIDLEASDLSTKAAELNGQRALAEIDRLKLEVKGLLDTVKQREVQLVKLEEDVKKATVTAISESQKAVTMHERNIGLQDQLRKLLQKMAELENRGGSGLNESPIVRDPNQPNPPLTYVKGIIKRIDAKDNTLVEVSVGSDHGVNKNHTLEVFRHAPRAEYLGMIRIVDSDHKQSVGKLIRKNLPSSPLQEGDLVASKISP